MGNNNNTSSNMGASTHNNSNSSNNNTTASMQAPVSSQRSQQISGLIQYAHTHYEENPTEALSCLMQALTLNSGQASADRAMERIRQELGPEVVGLVENRTARTERAMRIVQEMLEDESTLLYQQNKQHILQQAMEDGSSVVCTRCNGMVAATRWQQHSQYWCPAIESSPEQRENDEEGDNDNMTM